MRKCFSYSFIRSIFNSNILFFCCIFLVIKDKITVSDRWSINEISIFKLKGSNKEMDWKNIRLGRNILPVKYLFWRKNLKKQDDKTTILYHILYFKFTQNSKHSPRKLEEKNTVNLENEILKDQGKKNFLRGVY